VQVEVATQLTLCKFTADVNVAVFFVTSSSGYLLPNVSGTAADGFDAK
jgi:hypothetical protein